MSCQYKPFAGDLVNSSLHSFPPSLTQLINISSFKKCPNAAVSQSALLSLEKCYGIEFFSRLAILYL